MRIYDEPATNDRECLTLAEDDEHYYDLIPMLFNYRLVMTPKDNTGIWDWGWCYPDALTAIAALHIWDPTTQNEPQFWRKRPTRAARRAPTADRDPHYNRPRCAHGHHPADGPCPTDPDHCKGTS